MGRKKCLHGEDSDRYENGCCKICAKTRAETWNKNNISRRKEIATKYDSLNKEKKKIWRENNYEILLEKKRSRYLLNREIINLKNRRYKKNNKLLINAINSSRRAKIRGAGGKFTRKDIDLLLMRQSGLCAICNIRMKDYHIDHKTPVSKGGHNYPSNLQLLCPPCNLNKGAKIAA